MSATITVDQTQWPVPHELIAPTVTATAKELRKQARQIEKDDARCKREAKAYRKAEKQRDADHAAARRALLAVAADESKGYARVEAVRALRELGII